MDQGSTIGCCDAFAKALTTNYATTIGDLACPSLARGGLENALEVDWTPPFHRDLRLASDRQGTSVGGDQGVLFPSARRRCLHVQPASSAQPRRSPGRPRGGAPGSLSHARPTAVSACAAGLLGSAPLAGGAAWAQPRRLRDGLDVSGNSKPSLCASDLGTSPQTHPLCLRPSAQNAGGRYLRRFLQQWQLAAKSL